jgi:hypothetical protein
MFTDEQLADAMLPECQAVGEARENWIADDVELAAEINAFRGWIIAQLLKQGNATPSLVALIRRNGFRFRT